MVCKHDTDEQSEQIDRRCPLCGHRNGTKRTGEVDIFVRHACGKCEDSDGPCAAGLEA